MSIVTCLNEGSLNTRLTDKDLFKIRLSLSCLSNRVVVSSVMANLYLWTPPTADFPTSSWQFVKSGVPALVVSTGECGERNPRGVFIYLVDPGSGFSSWKEKLTVNSNYIQQQSNFHTLKLSDDTGAMAGIRFSEEEAANLFLKEVENNSQELLSPSSLPELNKLEIASSKERVKKFRKLKKVEISTPCLFSHVTSITSSTPVGELSPKSGERKNSLVNEQEKPTQVRRSFSMKSRKKSGETDENKNGIIQGQIDTFLNATGRRQAELVATRLQNDIFTHVYSSDLQRAAETAHKIVEKNMFFKNGNVIYDSQLREKSFGSCEGRPSMEMKEMAAKSNLHLREFVPEGGETNQQLHARVVHFIDNMCQALAVDRITKTAQQKDPFAHVLVSSHGGTIRQFLYYFAGQLQGQHPDGYKYLLKRGGVFNTGLCKFKIYIDLQSKRPSSTECLLLNNDDHLIFDVPNHEVGGEAASDFDDEGDVIFSEN